MTPETKTEVLQRGDLVDLFVIDKWKEGQAYVERLEEDGVVITMKYPAHDGCHWTYKYKPETVRKSKPQP